MSFVVGRDVAIQITHNDTLKEVYCARTMLLDFQTDYLEKTTTGDGAFRKFIPNRHSWTMECSGVIRLFDPFTIEETFQLQADRTTFTVKFVLESTKGDLVTFTGTGFFTKNGYSAAYNDAATFDLSIQGTGALTVSSTPGQGIWDEDDTYIVDADGSYLEWTEYDGIIPNDPTPSMIDFQFGDFDPLDFN